MSTCLSLNSLSRHRRCTFTWHNSWRSTSKLQVGFPCHLFDDASETAFGEVLEQGYPAFQRRRKTMQTEREDLAVILDKEETSQVLVWKQFIIYTDQQALHHIFCHAVSVGKSISAMIQRLGYRFERI